MTYFAVAFFMIIIGVVLGMRIERVHIRAKEMLHRGRVPCLQCEQFRGLLIDANEDLYRLQSANRAQASTLAQAQDQIKMTAVDTGEVHNLVRDECGVLVEAPTNAEVAELQMLSLKFPALRTHERTYGAAAVWVEPKPKIEWPGLFAVIMTAWLGLKSAVHFFLFGRFVNEFLPDYKRIAELEKDPYIRTDAEQIIALIDQGKWPADRTAA